VKLCKISFLFKQFSSKPSLSQLAKEQVVAKSTNLLLAKPPKMLGRQTEEHYWLFGGQG
jgi:hypothetical protein